MDVLSGDVVSSVASFAVVAGLVTVMPGLDMALVLRSAAVDGRGHAFATALGIVNGAMIWGAAAACGATALLTASHAAYTVLRIAGAAYLLWMGFGLLRSLVRSRSAVAVEQVPEKEVTGAKLPGPVVRPGRGLAVSYRRGLVTDLLNRDCPHAG